jgi:cell division protein FtsX
MVAAPFPCVLRGKIPRPYFIIIKEVTGGMPYWLAVIATLLLLAVVVYLLTNLIAAVNRVEKATRRVARLVDRPRRERAAVEQEIEKIHRAIKATVASSQDMARLEELEEKLERMRQHR